MLRMVPLLLRNAYGSPVPGRSYFAFNSDDRRERTFFEEAAYAMRI
jgi:hypothetical protein